MNGQRGFDAFGKAENRRRREEPDETVLNCARSELFGRRKRRLAAVRRQKGSVKRNDPSASARSIALASQAPSPREARYFH